MYQIQIGEFLNIKQMITIAYEPQVKRYFSSVYSRGFCLSSLCYLMVVLIPLLMLININYSWPQYERKLITPELQYKGYQINCLNSDNTVIYNSNFDGEIGEKNYNTKLSASIDGKMIQIIGSVSNSVQACNLQIYFLGRIETSIASILSLPLSLNSPNSMSLSTIKTRGLIQLSSSNPLPQSSILSINQTQYSSKYRATMLEDWSETGSKNISLKFDRRYENIQTLAASTLFSFDIKMKIQDQVYFKETGLIDKLRAIGPILIFIAIFLYHLVIDPLVDWMIDNKIYSGRTLHAKIKVQ